LWCLPWPFPCILSSTLIPWWRLMWHYAIPYYHVKVSNFGEASGIPLALVLITSDSFSSDSFIMCTTSVPRRPSNLDPGPFLLPCLITVVSSQRCLKKNHRTRDGRATLPKGSILQLPKLHIKHFKAVVRRNDNGLARPLPYSSAVRSNWIATILWYNWCIAWSTTYWMQGSVEDIMFGKTWKRKARERMGTTRARLWIYMHATALWRFSKSLFFLWLLLCSWD
jgi:hypothetical protein